MIGTFPRYLMGENYIGGTATWLKVLDDS